MKLKQQLYAIGHRLKSELVFYQRLLRHPRTPSIARLLLWLAIAYVLLPFDLIPDFIPLIGQLDDLIVVPMLIFLALKVIPQGVVAECRAQSKEGSEQ
ncbi:MAG: YkvA family protein [Methylophilaceae bacterium]|nr:YkvA family protein [Methylophilaceae bacterium]